MSVILTVMCHASTHATRDVAFPLDGPLDPQGAAKASAMAGTLRRVDLAWTSPARRAVETAAALCLDAIVDPALRDADYGAWAGRSLEDVAATDPESVSAWLSDPAAAPHGGESVIDLCRRVGVWLETLGCREGRVMAVTHAAVVRAAIVHALEAPPRAFWRIDVAPLMRARLRGRAGRWTLMSLR